MADINAYAGDEFPGAVSTVEASLAVGECASFATMDLLIKELNDNQDKASTIRFGRAYTDATPTQIQTVCVGA